MNTRKYLSTEQKILCAFFGVFFFQTWETGCKDTSGAVQISSDLFFTTWNVTPVVQEKRKVFSALCEIYYIQSQFSQPIIPYC